MIVYDLKLQIVYDYRFCFYQSVKIISQSLGSVWKARILHDSLEIALLLVRFMCSRQAQLVPYQDDYMHHA